MTEYLHCIHIHMSKQYCAYLIYLQEEFYCHLVIKQTNDNTVFNGRVLQHEHNFILDT